MATLARRAAFARAARGSALLLALAIVLILAAAGVALVRYAGEDRIDAARFAGKDPGLACAEAGLQYARRFFGSSYAQSHGWNDYLAAPDTDNPRWFRYDEGAGDTRPDLSSTSVPVEARGKSDGSTFDTGADLDGDGRADFWVSVRDDDDERPLGAPQDPGRDNNETIIVRAECTNPSFTTIAGGVETNAVLEATISHVQGSSGYGIAAGGSNSPDLVGGAP